MAQSSEPGTVQAQVASQVDKKRPGSRPEAYWELLGNKAVCYIRITWGFYSLMPHELNPAREGEFVTQTQALQATSRRNYEFHVSHHGTTQKFIIPSSILLQNYIVQVVLGRFAFVWLA